MMIDTRNMVPMTDANQNFSKVVRLVDENGMAVILKNNKPRYLVVDFTEYEEMQTMRAQRQSRIDAETQRLLEENREALQELAK